VADLQALRRAADLLEDWAKEHGYNAMLNETDPHADAGIKLYAVSLKALVAKARADAADFRWRAMRAELSPNESEEQG